MGFSSKRLAVPCECVQYQQLTDNVPVKEGKQEGEIVMELGLLGKGRGVISQAGSQARGEGYVYTM